MVSDNISVEGGQGLVHSYSNTICIALAHLSHLRNLSPASVKKAREASLKVKGANVFNIIPQNLRDITTGS